MLPLYQNLPQKIDPVLFSAGSFSVHWYSVMWVMVLLTTYLLLIWRIKKGEGIYTKDFIQDLLLNGFIGALIGGRVGYVLFYDFVYFIKRPLEIISPYDFSSGEWVGIYGMSYHGGVIGVILALAWTIRKHKEDFLKVADFIVPAFPLGFLFGRLGNFFNSELVGRVTEKPWGMYFNNDNFLRHPSQLYEAFGEGLFIFLILWFLRNKKLPDGVLSGLYLMLYPAVRFIIEFFRQPDEHLGFVFLNLSMGQVLSLVMFFVGVGMSWIFARSQHG